MPSFYAFLWSSTQPFIRYVIGLFCVALGWSIVLNIQPMLIKLIIDQVTLYQGAEIYSKILPYIFCYIFIGIAFIVLFRFHDYLILKFIPKQKEFLALKLMHRMMHHSAMFYQRHFVGNLTNKINDIILHTPELIKIITDKFTTCLFTLVFVLCNLAFIQPRFAWAMLVWLSIFVGGSLWLLFRHSGFAYASAESRSHVVGQLVDMLANIVSIRLFVRAKHEAVQLKKATSWAVQCEQARDRFFLKMHFFQGITFWVFEAVCFLWLLNGLSDGTISAGSFVLVFTLNLQILDQFWDLGSEVRGFWEKIGHLRQAFNTIYVEENIIQLPGTRPLLISKGEVVFENVHFYYEGSPPIFEDKSLIIPGGQTVGLVGHSGGGKSTFISLILRLYDVTSGSISIDGQDISKVTQDSLYHSIAVIPQDCPLFNRSLMENIRYGRLDALDEEVFEAARKAQVHEAILSLPHGYQTLAGEKGMRLSGGQRQRIAIARAILKDAPILVLDEATSQLDALVEEKLKETFEELMQGKTVFIIAHRLSTLTRVQRILVFDAGKIVQDGSHGALLQEEGLYRKLWEAQAEGFIGGSCQTPS